MRGSCLFPVAVALLLAACGQDRGDRADIAGPAPAAITGPLASPAPLVAEDDTLHFTGTEPFWGGEATGASLTYSTPERPQGAAIAVARSATRKGLAFSGMLEGKPFVLGVVNAQCSDGMSDRTYPFTATLEIAGEIRHGCAWSKAHPAIGPQRP